MVLIPMSDFLQVAPAAVHWDPLAQLAGNYSPFPSHRHLGHPLRLSEPSFFAMDLSPYLSHDAQHLPHASLGYGHSQSMHSRAASHSHHAVQDDQFFDPRYMQLSPTHDRQWALPSAHSYPHTVSSTWSEMSTSGSLISQPAHHNPYARASSSLTDTYAHTHTSIRPSSSPANAERVYPPLRQRAQRTGQACENCRGRKTKVRGCSLRL
jgi:hypothetical protein